MGRATNSAVERAEESEFEAAPRLRLVWLVGAGALWVFLVMGLVTFDAADPPTHSVWPPNDPVSNLCGTVGAYASYHILRALGLGAWLLLALLAVPLGSALRGYETGLTWVKALGITLLLVGFCGLAGLITPNAGPMPELGGGLVGLVASVELAARFGGLGTFIALAAVALIGAFVAYDEALATGWAWARDVMTGRVGPLAGEAARGAAARGAGGLAGALAAMRRKTVTVSLNDVDDPIEVDAAQLAAADEAERAVIAERRAKKKRVRVTPQPAQTPTQTIEADEEEEDQTPGAPQVFDREALKEKIAALPVRFGSDDRRSATDEDLRDLQSMGDLKGYKFPTLDLLESPEENFGQRLEELVRGQAESLESALRQYRIKGEVVGIESGPAITLYHVRLAPGTRVSALQAVSSDIARALRSVNIRIVANQVGRDTVGVEVPNPTKEKVRLRELMSDSARVEKMRLPMFLGKDASGEALIEDLTKMPHMLIAGTTGSGKSVCMNSIIMSFLYTKKPDELKLVLVDPKMVEMSQFKDIPHLMCPVVTEMAKAAAILEWAVRKMDERYELLAEAGCRDIAGYNALGWDELKERFTPRDGELSEEEAKRIPRKLPYMVYIVDELADLMLTNKEVEGSIIRIAQKARAVGIHLILATQRPQANVVTGLIKSNMPCRIAFKVASGMDSRIVLDQKGGELLLGMGDMLFLSPSSHKLTRCQGTLVDDAEIRRVARFMRDVASPTFERQLIQLRTGDADEDRLVATENNSSASLAAAQEDPLFDRAVEIVLETKRGSVSLLQRRLAIGYTRASRLIDLMGIANIIGEHKGSVAREVMITPEEWVAIKEMAAEMAARGERGSLGPGAAPPPANLDDDTPATALAEPDQAAPASEIEPRMALDDTDEPLFEEIADSASVAAVETNGNIDVEDDDTSTKAEVLDEEGGEEEYEDEDDEATDEYDEEDDKEDDDDDEDEPEDEYEDGEEEDEEDDEDAVDEADEGDEEEEEYEYVYVDEDGNEIDPADLDEYEEDDRAA